MAKQRLMILYIMLGLLGLLSLFLLISVTSIISFYPSIHRTTFPKTELYELQEFNPSDKSTRNGMVQITRKLKPHESITYRSKKGHFFTITSSFADEKFECTGSCHCEAKAAAAEERRTFANPLTLRLPLMFLVSAVSTSFAFNIAKKYFDTECILKFSDQCEDDKIVSDVEGCKIKEATEKIKEKEEEDVVSRTPAGNVLTRAKSTEETQIRKRSYRCSGYCLPNSKLTEHSLAKKRDEIGCQNFRTSSEVDLFDKPKIGGFMGYPYSSFGAKEKFLVVNLRPFCSEASKVAVGRSRSKIMYLCTGRSRDIRLMNFSNIECVLL